jgi:hypothetical protein
MYGIFSREIIKYTVIYGAYIRFWPTLLILLQSDPKFSLDYKGLQPGMAAQPIGPNK